MPQNTPNIGIGGNGNKNIPGSGSGNKNTSLGDNGVKDKISNINREKDMESLARADKNKPNLGSRAQTTGSSINSGKSGGMQNNKAANVNNGADRAGSLKQKRAQTQGDAQRKMANLKRQIEEEALKKLAAAYGIPEPITDKLIKSKKGQMILDMIDKKANPNINPFKKNPNKMDSEKSADEKSDEQTEKENASGEMGLNLSLKLVKWLIILGPMSSLILCFVVVIVACLSDEKVSSMILAGISSSEQEAIRAEVGSGDLVGKGGNFPDEYYERISKLGNVYSSQVTCEGDDCLSRPEFLYYLKIADIQLRYENKYNVKLDWYLLSATNLYQSTTTEETMEANLGGYDKDSVTNYNSISGLDWDNDYKNISGYTYLDASNSTYDLQILAKNMVKKKTTQSCIDSSGNIVKTQEDEDIEDKYFEVGGSKRLSCSSGQKYSINSVYTKDMDKYNEFMLEYIDKKMFQKGTGNKGSSSNCTITGSNGYIWPIGGTELTNGTDGKYYATGEPELTAISSRFSSNESFRGRTHGAIDIPSNGKIGTVNVIAASSGTVVYPTNNAQTSYTDNGSLSNNDGGGYGNYIMIKHDDGNYTLYGHLAQNTINVMAGDKVQQGQVIAKVGNSGQSTGAHLHFEMRNGESSANKIDPLKFVDPANPRKGISTNCKEGSSMADSLVTLALSQLNDPEAINGKKYWTWFGRNSRFEWCAAFVSWVVANTEYNGEKLSDTVNYKSASTGQWINYFYNTSSISFIHNDNCSKLSGKNGSGSNYTPKPGDIIFFDWNGDWNGTVPTVIGPADHIGFVQKVENGKIITIEGNSSNKVAERTYNLNSCQVIGFGSWY